jgi:hypothetical protein
VKELEQRLAEAAPHYPFPPTPAVAEAAATRLGPRRRPRRTRLLIGAAAAVVAALVAVLALSPGARSAVLDWLDAIPGVRIHRVEKLPVSNLMPGAELEFGRRVSLNSARRRAGFTVRLPDELGDPTAVYFDRDRGGTVVTARYGDRLVLSEWTTSAVLFDKLLLGPTRVERTTVGDNRAAWISGGDHAVYYLGAVDAAEHARQGSLAGNVLLWQDGLVGYRLETAASKKRALDLAESLRP